MESGEPFPIAEQGLEFDRTMKLLARWQRRGGRLGAREVGRDRLQAWMFEEGMAALAGRMRALGLPTGAPPAEGGAGSGGA